MDMRNNDSAFLTGVDRKSYSELRKLPTFIDRYRYLKLPGQVGIDTFGFDRYLNQKFYTSTQWRQIRQFVIARDGGCDLGIPDRPIFANILVHHMNPISKQELRQSMATLLDPENLITTTKNTHNAIHYGSEELLVAEYVPRKPNDHVLW